MAVEGDGGKILRICEAPTIVPRILIKLGGKRMKKRKYTFLCRKTKIRNLLSKIRRWGGKHTEKNSLWEPPDSCVSQLTVPRTFRSWSKRDLGAKRRITVHTPREMEWKLILERSKGQENATECSDRA